MSKLTNNGLSNSSTKFTKSYFCFLCRSSLETSLLLRVTSATFDFGTLTQL